MVWRNLHMYAGRTRTSRADYLLVGGLPGCLRVKIIFETVHQMNFSKSMSLRLIGIRMLRTPLSRKDMDFEKFIWCTVSKMINWHSHAADAGLHCAGRGNYLDCLLCFECQCPDCGLRICARCPRRGGPMGSHRIVRDFCRRGALPQLLLSPADPIPHYRRPSKLGGAVCLYGDSNHREQTLGECLEPCCGSSSSQNRSRAS